MNAEKVRILLVEDEEAHAELVRRTFRPAAGQMSLTLARNLEEARARLAEALPDLVIADLRLPDGGGTELIPADDETSFPVVILTGRGDERAAADAIKLGAQDYVVKSLAGFEELPRTIKRVLRDWNFITERKRAEEKQLSHAKRLEIVGKIARAAGSEIEPDELFRAIAGEIRRAVPCDRCVVGGIDIEKEVSHYFTEDSDTLIGPNTDKEDIKRKTLSRVVYRTKQPINVPDLLENQWRENRFTKAGYRSALIIPVLQEGHCVAHMGLQSRQANAFSKEHEELLTSVAAHLGSAIRNAALYGESKERAERLEVVGKIARAVGSELEPDELFRTIASEIRRAVPCDRCVVAALDLEKGVDHYFTEDTDTPIGPPTDKEELKRGIPTQTVYQTKRPLHVPDLLESQWREDRLAREGYRSALIIPIIQEDRCVAHMGLQSRQANAFSKEHEELLTSVAAHLGSAIRNAALYRESEERAERLEIVGKIARVVGSTLEPKELFETIVSEIRRAVPCERCIISGMGHETERYYSWHIDADIEVRPRTTDEDLSAGEWFSREVYETKRPRNCPDLREIQMSWARRMVEAGFRGHLTIPILQDDRCVAHISLARTRVGAFPKEDEELLTAVAGHLGSAIRNAALYKEAKGRASRLAALNKINKEITENLDLDETLDNIVKGAVELTGGDLSRIYLLDEASRKFIVRGLFTDPGAFPADFQEEDIPVGKGVISKVVQSGEGWIIPDVQEETEWAHPERNRKLGLRACIYQPLAREGKVFGAINCISKERDFFSQEDLEFLGALASQAAIAIQNAQAIEALRRNEARLAEAQRIGHVGSFELDVVTNIGRWSDENFRIFGHTPRKMESTRDLFLGAIHPDDKEFVLKKAHEALYEGKPFEFDFRILTPDGEERFLHTRGEVTFDEDGRPLLLAGTNQDITERVRADEEIRRSHQMVMRAEKLSSIGTLTAGAAHEILNPANIIGLHAQRLMWDSEEGSPEWESSGVI
ncbi:GAF domain-containing protein, partial [Nitrospinota bacterium]